LIYGLLPESGQTNRTGCPAGSSSRSRSSARWLCGRGWCCSTRWRARLTRNSWPTCSTWLGN